MTPPATCHVSRRATTPLRELVESREKLNLAEPLALPPHSLRVAQFVEP